MLDIRRSSAAELFVRCLENERVRTIFGLPGEENMDVLDALLDSSIRFISVRHEQGAAFMADIQGRLTGTAGVCLSTLGPGAANLLTGVADANLDRAPLVALTGQTGRSRMHKESHQYLDVVGMFRPVTKWNTLVQTPENIPEIVRKAFKLAQTEKMGATHIDLPEDAAAEDVEGEPLEVTAVALTEPRDEYVRQAAELISNARFPLILAGNGVARTGASGALQELAETAHIPVANTFMGKGSIPYTHHLSLLSVGLQARDYVMGGFDRADLVIAVGYDMVEYHPELWNPDRDVTIVHIDTTPAESDAHYVPRVEVVGDIALSLARVGELVEPRGEEGEATFTHELRDTILGELREHATDEGYPLKPQRIIADMRAVMGEEDIVLSDVGAHKMWIARLYPCHRPNTCLISNGFASMGIALPGAFSAKLCRPERRVLAACGDGGFLMNVQELETIVREGGPIVALVWNDGGYALIDWKQRIGFGRPAYVKFGNPDFVRLAQSFGARGARVESADELRPALEEAFESGETWVIDCPVDYSENLRLTEKLGRLTRSE